VLGVLFSLNEGPAGGLLPRRGRYGSENG
jgi:hypothetical protein